MVCPRCGSAVDEGADYCPVCGKVQLAPEPERADSGGGPVPSDPHAGKFWQILGFAFFMAGVIWAFGSTAATQGLPNYTGPLVVIFAGVLVWAVGRFRNRRKSP